MLTPGMHARTHLCLILQRHQAAHGCRKPVQLLRVAHKQRRELGQHGEEAGTGTGDGKVLPQRQLHHQLAGLYRDRSSGGAGAGGSVQALCEDEEGGREVGEVSEGADWSRGREIWGDPEVSERCASVPLFQTHTHTHNTKKAG